MTVCMTGLREFPGHIREVGSPGSGRPGIGAEFSFPKNVVELLLDYSLMEGVVELDFVQFHKLQFLEFG